MPNTTTSAAAAAMSRVVASEIGPRCTLSALQGTITLRGSPLKISSATFWSRMDTPIVMSSWLISGAARSGRISRPNIPAPSMKSTGTETRIAR